jgi:apolipoprotein N-acyltransferase
VKYFSPKKLLSSRYFFALVAGLMLALSFPNFSAAGFAWIAPGLILFCAIGKSGRQQFWIGYVAGLAHFLFALDWLLAIPFPAGAIAGWIALSGYLAFYMAVWVWLCWKIFSRLKGRGENKKFSDTTWKQRALWSLSCAVIWVALEITMARLFSGFPWNFLGITQYKIVPLIQIASFTGVYGVSFLLVWFAVSFASAGKLLIEQSKYSRVWSGEIILPALVAAFGFGAARINEKDTPTRHLKVALVQPSIPQTLIFDPSQDDVRFEKIIQLSEKALAENPDVLIWPEASMPSLDEEKFHALTNFIAAHHVWMIFGTDDATVHELPNGNLETNYYNGSFLFSPDGNAVGRYHKQRLVIFGEYVPLERWLPFMKWLTPIDGGFTPGNGPVPFELQSPRAKISVLICFEDVFPHYAREHVETDTDFLLNLTNDGWFGEGSAQRQQAANAFFRAVENGLPIVRCTNNGLTCWADKLGRLRKYLGEDSGNIYREGFLIAEIPLLAENEKRPQTFYRQHGDWFGWSCVAASIALLFVARRKSSGAPPIS